MNHDMREIAINARRARYIADHWDDEQPAPGLPFDMPLSTAIAGEIGFMDVAIQGYWKKQHPELSRELEELHQQMTTKEFWEHLAETMVGTQFSACGLKCKEFTYRSALRPLWRLEDYAPSPRAEPSPAAYASPPPFPSSLASAPARPRRKRKWNPVGCLGSIVRFFFKSIVRLVLVGWLVWYAFKLWSPPAGDAPAPEPAKPAAQAAKVAANPLVKKPETKAPQTGGRRIVLEKPVAIYRFDENKRPVVAGHAPAGTVVTVTGKLNAKVVRVTCELPNGRKAQGMARLADLPSE